MIPRSRHLIATIAVLALLILPSSARAEWFFTPFAGVTTGGSTIDAQGTFGLGAGWMGRGPIGFELEAGWTPDFFDSGMADAQPLLSDSSVSTWMANIVLAPPTPDDAASGQGGAMRWVPYASGGLGAIRTRIESDLGLIDVKETNFGWNAGAGVMALWNRFGVRGDARYFRAMQEELAEDVLSDEDDQKFSFWRVTGGIVFRWGGM